MHDIYNFLGIHVIHVNQFNEPTAIAAGHKMDFQIGKVSQPIRKKINFGLKAKGDRTHCSYCLTPTFLSQQYGIFSFQEAKMLLRIGLVNLGTPQETY